MSDRRRPTTRRTTSLSVAEREKRDKIKSEMEAKHKTLKAEFIARDKKRRES